MGLFINFFQFLEGRMRVNFRGGQALMTQYLLDDAQIRIVVEHRRGERVPEDVGTSFFLRYNLGEASLYYDFDIAALEPVAVLLDEQGFHHGQSQAVPFPSERT